MTLLKPQQKIYLVADIGGTNIRLAQTNVNNEITAMRTYRCANFASLSEVILKYLTEQQLSSCEIHACLAIACPTDDDWISMTNLPWQFSQKELKRELNLASLIFINDYTAIAMAIPLLSNTQMVQIGAGKPVDSAPISVCGPGTGLGVATLISLNQEGQKYWHCVNGEGGHIDFAPIDDIEIAILKYLKQLKHRVSYEQLLSGYGLEQIYRALLFIQSKEEEYDTSLCAADISEQALLKSCDICEQALLQFCKILGSFAGNLALLSNSLGGVYIAGGIVPRFIDFVQQSDFRKRFEAKGRLSDIPKKTPTYIITESQPGLLGTSVYLNQRLQLAN